MSKLIDIQKQIEELEEALELLEYKDFLTNSDRTFIQESRTKIQELRAKLALQEVK